MSYTGKVRNGVVVLPPEVQLPEGAEVRVEVDEDKGVGAREGADEVYRMSDLATATGIRDLATNIDHYLYGHTKASDAREWTAAALW